MPRSCKKRVRSKNNHDHCLSTHSRGLEGIHAGHTGENCATGPQICVETNPEPAGIPTVSGPPPDLLRPLYNTARFRPSEGVTALLSGEQVCGLQLVAQGCNGALPSARTDAAKCTLGPAQGKRVGGRRDGG